MSPFRIIGILVVAAVALIGCSATALSPTNPPAQGPPPCGPAPVADVATPEGWLGRIAADPTSTGLVVDDGRGQVVAHEATTPFPLASAAKVVHLIAYAAAVADGRVRPDEPVALADWERWYLPGTDAGAHPVALRRLGVRAGGTVTVERLVTAVVQESDNAAADWLRARLGDDALRAAAASTGWTGVDLPSFAGAVARLALPEQVPADALGRPALSALDAGLGARVAGDPAFPAEVLRRYEAATTTPGWAATAERWALTTAAGTSTQLLGTYRAVATGAVPGADVAQRFLTWQGPQPGLGGVLGFKSGSYPGVLTLGSLLRRDDGSLGYAVVLARGLPAVPSVDRQTRGQQLMALGALRSARTLDRLRCVA